jgi:hypothetical protein
VEEVTAVPVSESSPENFPQLNGNVKDEADAVCTTNGPLLRYGSAVPVRNICSPAAKVFVALTVRVVPEHLVAVILAWEPVQLSSPALPVVVQVVRP